MFKVFEVFPDGLVIIRAGKVLFANRQVAILLGLNDYDGDMDPEFLNIAKLLDVTDSKTFDDRQ